MEAIQRITVLALVAFVLLGILTDLILSVDWSRETKLYSRHRLGMQSVPLPQNAASGGNYF